MGALLGCICNGKGYCICSKGGHLASHPSYGVSSNSYELVVMGIQGIRVNGCKRVLEAVSVRMGVGRVLGA